MSHACSLVYVMTLATCEACRNPGPLPAYAWLMRTLTDETGQLWEVVVGRESWGTLVALFVPRAGGQGVRSALLQSASYEGAYDELDGLEEIALGSLFARAQPVSLGREDP